ACRRGPRGGLVSRARSWRDRGASVEAARRRRGSARVARERGAASRRRPGRPAGGPCPPRREGTLMRFLVVGAGSIGTRHARNLLALGHEVAGWDASPHRIGRARAEMPGFVAAAGLGGGGGRRADAGAVWSGAAAP